MPEAAIRGAKIYYEMAGSGPPLVYITGQGTGPQARAALIAGLARHHTVLTYDQRGTGRSEKVVQGHPISELAEDVIGLMDAAGFADAHLVSHSTGTGFATVVAATRPERVKSLVLAAPWTHADPYLLDVQTLRKTAIRTLPADQYVQFNAHLLYGTDFRRMHQARFAAMAEAAKTAPPDAQGMCARLDAILAFDARPYYAQIRCPTLVMGIRDDLIMPHWFAEEAARLIAASRLIVLDHGGHMFPEVLTDTFVSAVDSFLKSQIQPSTERAS